MERTESRTIPTLMDAVDIICTIENEYVHQDIQCDICSGVCPLILLRYFMSSSLPINPLSAHRRCAIPLFQMRRLRPMLTMPI